MQINILKTLLKLWHLHKLLRNPKLTWVWIQAGQIHGKHTHPGLLDKMPQRHWEIGSDCAAGGLEEEKFSFLSPLLISSIICCKNIHFYIYNKECSLCPHCCRAHGDVYQLQGFITQRKGSSPNLRCGNDALARVQLSGDDWLPEQGKPGVSGSLSLQFKLNCWAKSSLQLIQVQPPPSSSPLKHSVHSLLPSQRTFCSNWAWNTFNNFSLSKPKTFLQAAQKSVITWQQDLNQIL